MHRRKVLLAGILIIVFFSLVFQLRNSDRKSPQPVIENNVVLPTVSIGANEEYYPTDEWRTSTPEEQGMDSEKLYNLVKGIKESNTDIDSMVIVRNGYIVTEANISYGKNAVRALNSCTKSITSAVIGAAIMDGYIENTDLKLLDLYSDMEIENNNSLKKQITLENLLTMTAGFDWDEWGCSYEDMNNPSIQLGSSSDTVQFMLDQPVSTEPGTQFNYNSGAPHLLSAAFTTLTGKNLADYADERLFKPLGITGEYWKDAQDGITFGGYGLFMSAEDMAKIGYLYLKMGKWDNQQLIQESWIEESTKKHIDVDFYGTSKGYGYLWWINDFGGYSARGLYGQYIIVMPDLNMVVVFQSHFSDGDLLPLHMMKNSIIPAVKSSDPLPANKEAADKLYSICNE